MATSPPTLTHLNLPTSKKRPSIGSPSQSATTAGYSSQSAKRPKHQHPLRQTSFPATEAQAGFYTPSAPRSETGSVSASVTSGFSGTTAGGKRSRGRPKKRKNQPHDIQTGRGSGGGDYDDGASTILEADTPETATRRSRRGGTKSVISGAGGGAGDDAADDDDDPNAPDADPNSDESRRLHAEMAREKEKIAQLQEALTPEQMQRYTSYLRTKLKGSTLKRIVNQTVSQSVTSNPLQAVQWVGKVFVGEIVELAREVQGEWAGRWEIARDEERERRDRERERDKYDSEGELKKPTTTSAPAIKPTEDLYAGANPHRGGLLPDHLREALRRYKADGEGGGVGLGGYSFGNLGLKGEAVPRLGMGNGSGRRLFR
ncbi:hypothetical protein GJ744_010252 [Endocarpon pusillum]|uniref:TAFII28-like protein domain-containing protein n=1 Tax=Endocarpon pusillum TaxID=364733 RepID=A0A8H7E327_9EURO|nr:hypothetical protein GJ744_010252 [Endocarpon pusillum]